MSEDALKQLQVMNPNMAIAATLNRLTDKDFIDSLTKLSSDKERQRILLALSIGEVFEWDWLKSFARERMLLNASDKKGFGRTTIVEVLRGQMDVQKRNVNERLRDFVEGRRTET